jgi:two-component system sensor histidine kinase RegB
MDKARLHEFDQAPASRNLRRLVILRTLAIAGQSGAIAVVSTMLEIPLPIAPMAMVIALLAVANAATCVRLRFGWPVGDAEIFAQLLVDAFALSALLYLSGGAENPFASLYLVPVVLAAITLPWAYTWGMTGVVIAAYTLLLRFNVPLPQHAMGGIAGHMDMFSLHIFGMWVTLALSAVLIAWFAVKMARSLRERDRLLALAREDSLRNEQIVALATLAAGAAHELGTPLSTMAIVAHEIRQQHGRNAALASDLDILERQIRACKGIISQMLATAGQARLQQAAREPLDAFVSAALAKWQLMRPGAALKYRQSGSAPAPFIAAEQTLSQALINLLNNAADVSPNDVEVDASWDERQMRILISDRGPGITPDVARRAGHTVFSAKPDGKGFGLGLLLANATLDRFGGTVRLSGRKGGGTCTDIRLPLDRLAVPS